MGIGRGGYLGGARGIPKLLVHIQKREKRMVIAKLMKRKAGLAILVASTTLASTVSFGISSAHAAAGDINYSYFTKNFGWTPMKGRLPNMDCRDRSYATALIKGINLGVYDAAPYMYMEKGKLTGIDYEINVAVLEYIGIKKHKNIMLQWPQMVPALLSKRIDVIGGDIHENPDRLKSIAFTTTAWWYGTALMTKSDNPKGIKTWADLQKPGVKVGVLTGSFVGEFLAKLSPKPDLVLVPDSNSEFQSLASGKVDVVVDDAPKMGAYMMNNPGSGLKILSAAGSNPPAEFQDNDAKFALRPADCTLNQAYSRGLAELRDHGVITQILKKYGLGDGDNLFMPEYKP
jgi:ABC-type amino acid transport substrate-binding protein